MGHYNPPVIENYSSIGNAPMDATHNCVSLEFCAHFQGCRQGRGIQGVQGAQVSPPFQ